MNPVLRLYSCTAMAVVMIRSETSSDADYHQQVSVRRTHDCGNEYPDVILVRHGKYESQGDGASQDQQPTRQYRLVEVEVYIQLWNYRSKYPPFPPDQHVRAVEKEARHWYPRQAAQHRRPSRPYHQLYLAGDSHVTSKNTRYSLKCVTKMLVVCACITAVPIRPMQHR